MLQELPKEFNHRDFPELKGFRITTKIIPSKYDNTGKILDWTVEYLRWPEEVEAGVQVRLTAALKKEFLQFDCQTFCADGRWFWYERNHEGIYWPLFFKKEYFVSTEQVY